MNTKKPTLNKTDLHTIALALLDASTYYEQRIEEIKCNSYGEKMSDYEKEALAQNRKDLKRCDKTFAKIQALIRQRTK